MQLYYAPDILPNDTSYTFGKEESRHIIKVLRHKIGDMLLLTNGHGYQFQGRIVDATPNKCTIEIQEVLFKPKKEHYLHIAIAPTKLNDRFEWFLEKATEIGIDEITPIICERSIRRVVKRTRIEKIVQGAMKQSLQWYLPKLNNAIPLEELLQNCTTENRFIAHCEKLHKRELINTLQPKTANIILIGPEGDFTTKEIELAVAKKFVPIGLGETRLRTETAAIAATFTHNLINQL